MPASQSRLLICALLSSLSAVGWADTVTVNTVADEDAVNNDMCSLREAVTYLHTLNIKVIDLAAYVAVTNLDIGLINKRIDTNQDQINFQESLPADKQDQAEIKRLKDAIADDKKKVAAREEQRTAAQDAMRKFRSEGVNGCKSGDTTSLSHTVSIPYFDTPYTLSSTISVQDSMTIRNQNTIDTSIDLSKAVNRILFKPAGQFRLFEIQPYTYTYIVKDADGNITFETDGNGNIIKDENGNPKPLTKDVTITPRANFENLDFQGCTTGPCANLGGIFYNASTLVINQSILSNGSANKGGAIFNDAKAAFSANQDIFQNNNADEGAAVYSEELGTDIHRGLFINNNGQNIVKVNKSTNVEAKIESPGIEGATFTKNTGTAISARTGFVLNNLTIVLNTAGVDFNTDSPTLHNSIIAGNGQDCLNFGTTAGTDGEGKPIAYFTNNVFQTGCSLGDANRNNYKISGVGNETLIADANNDGKCDAPPAVGLLCPLAANGGLTQNFKPRLLVSYNTLADSVIVNKGYIKAYSNLGIQCGSRDQREQIRQNLLDKPCDIGAVELQEALAGESPHQGQDIVAGDPAVFDILEKIGDAELWPAASCPSLYGPGTADNLDGCVYSPTKFGKGYITFDNIAHTVTYRSTIENFHGYEDFDYYLTTTFSRFNDSKTDKTKKMMKVNVRVVSAPQTNVRSKSLDTGAINILALAFLGLLLAFRRFNREQ